MTAPDPNDKRDPAAHLFDVSGGPRSVGQLPNITDHPPVCDQTTAQEIARLLVLLNSALNERDALAKDAARYRALLSEMKSAVEFERKLLSDDMPRWNHLTDILKLAEAAIKGKANG